MKFWNFVLITKLPSTLSLFFPHGVRTPANVGNGAVTGRRPLAVFPAKPVLRAPGFDETSLPDTSHARHAVERRRLAVAALDVRATRRRANVPAAILVALQSQLHFLLSALPLPKAKGRVSLRQSEHRRPPWPPPPPTASTRSPILRPPSTQATPGNGFPSAHWSSTTPPPPPQATEAPPPTSIYASEPLLAVEPPVRSPMAQIEYPNTFLASL